MLYQVRIIFSAFLCFLSHLRQVLKTKCLPRTTWFHTSYIHMCVCLYLYMCMHTYVSCKVRITFPSYLFYIKDLKIGVFYGLLFFYCCSSTVVSISPTTTPPHPTHPHLPPVILPHFGFVHVSFLYIPWWPCPFFSPLSPPTSPLFTVSLFFISLSLALFVCLFVLLIKFHL